MHLTVAAQRIPRQTAGLDIESCSGPKEAEEDLDVRI